MKTHNNLVRWMQKICILYTPLLFIALIESGCVTETQTAYVPPQNTSMSVPQAQAISKSVMSGFLSMSMSVPQAKAILKSVMSGFLEPSPGFGAIKEVKITSDRLIFYYHNNYDSDSQKISPITVPFNKGVQPQVRFNLFPMGLRSRYEVVLSDKWALNCDTKEKSQQIVDAFNVLNRAAANRQANFENFKPKAAAWRALASKPRLPEAAERQRILAENAFQEKNFDQALDYYEAALEIEPCWPEGQFNAALISGDTENFSAAAFHARCYLELAPDASDARTLKEKMIVWEDKAQRQ